jgi:hypothetical protein
LRLISLRFVDVCVAVLAQLGWRFGSLKKFILARVVGVSWDFTRHTRDLFSILMGIAPNRQVLIGFMRQKPSNRGFNVFNSALIHLIHINRPFQGPFRVTHKALMTANS